MNKEVKIKLGNKEFKLKNHSYRAMFMFEDISGKQVTEMSTFKDQLMYFYCLISVSNKDFPYTFDSFVDLLEEDESILQEFNKINNGEDSKKK